MFFSRRVKFLAEIKAVPELVQRAMKNKPNQSKRQAAGKSPARLKRLKALANRLHGALPNFMANGELQKMREEWDEHEKQNQIKAPLGAKSL